MAFSLFLVSPVHQGGPNQADSGSDVGEGSANSGQLLMIDDGLQDARAASAIFFGPIDSGPSARREFLTPSDAPAPLALIFGEEIQIVVGMIGFVLLQPGAKLSAKLFVFRGEVEIHPSCPLLCLESSSPTTRSYESV